MKSGTVERLGEDALLLRLGDGIDPATNAAVHALASAIAEHRPDWLLDIVPAYASLALFIDPDAFADEADPLAEAEGWLEQRVGTGKHGAANASPASRIIEITVHYGGSDGPDLPSVAEHAGLTPAEVVARHCAGEYRVAMLGFAPGFPYLIGLDPRLATPRLDTPHTQVPGGSVGIGGTQTGIYPRPGPGGWRIIGRTGTSLFDPARESPSLLLPGDRVRFVPADAGETP